MAVPAGDLLPALERGSIDAVEFLAPATDLETGLQKHAPYYYAPGFNKPNGASELMLGLKAWEQLTPDLQTMVAEAARAEHTLGLADAHERNATALKQIIEDVMTKDDQQGVQQNTLTFVVTGSTFEEPRTLPTGIPYVLIDGRFVIEDGRRTDVMAGRAVRRTAT